MPQVSTRFSLRIKMSRLTQDGTAEPVSRDQILRRGRRQENIYFPCSGDYEQDWQPYSVDPYSCYMCDHTYIHTYIHTLREAKKRKKPQNVDAMRETGETWVERENKCRK